MHREPEMHLLCKSIRRQIDYYYKIERNWSTRLNLSPGFMIMNRLIFVFLLLFVTGCSGLAPKYNTDFNNITQLRTERLKLNPVRVGPVTKDPATSDVDRLTIRGGSYSSPYGSFTAYLEAALKQELEDARLLNPTSSIELSAVLLRNSLDASGIVTGVAEIEARFTVRNRGEIKYEKVKIAQHTWESSFMGSIAIPKARQNYPVLVQKLIGLLFSDPEFIYALR